MRTYGLIGFPLTHSFSVHYFAEKFQREGITGCVYKNFAIESIEELSTLLKTEQLSGLNVTSPYKESVIEYLDEIDEGAQAIGAVNCIKFTNGKLTGYNTDIYGFRESLRTYIGEARVSALILGTGGSSKAVSHALDQLCIPYKFVSRRKKAEWFTYHDITAAIIKEYKLIINTTPLGMFPLSDGAPDMPYDVLTPDHYLYDLIYNPAETQFLQQGIAHQAHIKNGLEMLHLQAEKNWEIWNEQF
jgi:shikimate dehydrogenase